MKYIHLVCLIVFIRTIDCANIPSDDDVDADCDDLLRKADQGLNKIMFFSDPQIDGFHSAQHLKTDYCDPYPTYLKMATNYTKCLKSFSRTLLTMVARNVKKIHKTICDNPDKLDEAYSHVKCMDATNKEEIAKVGYMGVSLVDFVSGLEKVDDIIPAACCGQRVYVQRSTEKISEICSDKTGPNTGEFLSLIIKSMLGDVIDLICGKYPDNESCEREIPQLFNQTKESLDQFKVLNHSFAYPTVKMLKRLDSLTL